MQKLKCLWICGLLLVGLCSFVPAPHPTSVEKLPGGAYLTIQGKFGGDISKKEILKTKTLAVDGCKVGSQIFTYTLEIHQGNTLHTFQEESNVFSKAILLKMKELNPGDSFEFKKVKAYLPNGKDQIEVHSKRFVVVTDQV